MQYQARPYLDIRETALRTVGVAAEPAISVSVQ